MLIAYLAGGRLVVRDGDTPPRAIESRFGQAVRDRAVRESQRHAWKSEGRGAKFMSGGALWGLPEGDPAVMRIAITGLSASRAPGRVLYALATDDVHGLFEVDVRSGEEKRLFHGNQVQVSHPAARPEVELLACSVPHRGGSANLAVMQADGSDLLEVTEGDSADLAPSWVPGQPELVYQSAGLGRDKQGNFLGYGAASVQRVNLKTGKIDPVLEDASHDLLGPRLAPDGTLWCIRRPWRSGTRLSVWRALLDALLLPWRILVALFQWLNFFAVRYSGKPLAGGDARQKAADLRQMMVWGNLIDADVEARRSRDRGEDAPSLVPQDWQLVRMPPGKPPETVARAVLSFDLVADGSVVWSNGSAVFQLAPGGTPARVCTDERIEQVVSLG